MKSAVDEQVTVGGNGRQLVDVAIDFVEAEGPIGRDEFAVVLTLNAVGGFRVVVLHSTRALTIVPSNVADSS